MKGSAPFVTSTGENSSGVTSQTSVKDS
jgi:hypothetical protein